MINPTPLKEIEMFLLDMDGTVYFENQLIPGAAEFIDYLIQQGKKYVFLTNNSSESGKNYVKKVSRLGIPCTEENVFTSGMATGIYMAEHHPHKKIYLLGTKSLYEELQSYGVEIVSEDATEADIVLVGFDKELTYPKLVRACELLDEGAEFIATHPDMVCPMKNNRYIPDCGSFCQMITTATGKKPKIIGKPDRAMVDILAAKHHIPNTKIAMVGDRIYTDIATGINADAVSILVLSGETTPEVLSQSTIKPHYVFDSILDVYQAVK
jgi:HAD superfamily hydrolase (TIGR01457 family)